MGIERNRESSKGNELDRDYVKLLYEGKEVAFIYLDKQVEVIDNIECLLGGTRTGKAYTIDRIDTSVASVAYECFDSSQNFLFTKIMVHNSCFVTITSGSEVRNVDFKRLCNSSFEYDFWPDIDIEFCVDKKVYNLREIDTLSIMLGDFHIKTNDYEIHADNNADFKFGIIYYKNNKRDKGEIA